MRLPRKNTLVGIVLAVISLALYVQTLSPSVGFDDSGELAASQYMLGIAHPTGYPLFTLIGRAFILLPVGESVIWKLNLLSAAFCAIAVFLSFRFFLILFSISANSHFDRIAAAIAALSLAFSSVYWSQALSLEVYALHILFITLSCLLFLSANRGDIGNRQTTRLWILFAFVLGLGFTNHLMMVLLGPAFLYLLLATHGWKLSLRRILIAIPPFVAGLSVYLYFPIRASVKPAMNWGDPRTLESFWRQISGAQFRYMMFSSDLEFVLGRVREFFASLPQTFGYVPLLLVPIGLWALRRYPRLLIFSLLLFFGCVLYAANYNIPDIRSYYLQAHLAIALWIAFGVRAGLSAAPARLRKAAVPLALSVFFFPLVLNYRSLDRSHDYAVQEYTRNVLSSMDSGGVIFSNEYWIVNSPADYLQQVEKFRPDLVVLDVGLFGHDWFYDQLETRHPGFLSGSRREIESYRIEIRKQLRGELDTVTYNARLAEMFRSLVKNLRVSHKVYVTSNIDIHVLDDDYYLVPSGMVFRLMHGDDPAVIPDLRDFAFRPLPSQETNPMSEIIRLGYADGYANQGNYRLALGDTATGVALLRKALDLNPGFVEVAQLLGKIHIRP